MDEPTVARLRELLAAEHDVACAILFGSRARGTHAPASDVDVAIRTRGADLLDLAARLSLALELEVDVVDLDAATIPLLRSILADGVPVASNAPGALGSFYAHVLADLETDWPAYDRMAQSYLRHLGGGSAGW